MIGKILYRLIKRLFDIFAGLIGVVILIPVTVIIKIAYMLTGDFHRIFYVQPRIGKNGKTIKIIKYRSMVPDAEKVLKELMAKDKKIKSEYEKNKKLKNDPRVTRVGKVIRRLSIDELPQLINVLFGQMSVVGNRPYLLSEKKDLGGYYDSIIKTKPGITGLWQVSGHNDVSFEGRVELEATYSDIASLGLDLMIIFRTFKAVFGVDSKGR